MDRQSGRQPATTDGGTTWVNQVAPAGVGYLVGVACGSTSKCVAVAGSPGTGAIITTKDHGVTWTSQPVPDGAESLTSASCATGNSCAVVGQNQQSGAIVVGYGSP